MADTKITALAAITTVDPAADVLPIVDVSDTSMAASGTTKKITSNQILGAGGTATLASATITGDLTVDTSTLKVDSANNRVGIGTASPISQFANTNTTDTITGTVTDGFAWRSVSNDWAAAIIARPASGNAYALRAHTGGATASDYPLWLSSGASAGNTVLSVTGNGIFTFGDGAGGTRMTLNSTGLGVGDAPATNSRITIGSTNATGFQYALRTTGITTGRSQIYLNNTSGDLIAGIEGSSAGSSITGSAAYSGFIGTFTNNPFYLVANSAIRATIDTAGNVGVGVTPSASWFTGAKVIQFGGTGAIWNNGSNNTSVSSNAIVGNSGSTYIFNTAASYYSQTTGAHIFYTAPSGTAGNAITWTQAMTLDASGNLLVGTTSTSNTTQGFKILSTGRFYGVMATGGYAIMNHTGGSGTEYIYEFQRAGTAVGSITTTTTSTAYVTSSDYRLKETVQPLSGGLARVNALKPSIYKWKSDGSSGEGFLAHELAEVVPSAVTGEKDAVNEDGSIKAQGVDLSKVVPILVAAIKELTARVEALEA